MEVLPYIKDNINSKAEYNIVSAAESLKEVYDYIECQSNNAYKKYVSDNILSDSAKELPPIILKEVIRQWIFHNTGNLKDITGKHIDMVVELLNNTVSKKVKLPYSITIKKGYRGIEFEKKSQPKEKINQVILENGQLHPVEKFSLSIEKAGENKENIPDLLYTKWLDYDKINRNVFPL